MKKEHKILIGLGLGYLLYFGLPMEKNKAQEVIKPAEAIKRLAEVIRGSEVIKGSEEIKDDEGMEFLKLIFGGIDLDLDGVISISEFEEFGKNDLPYDEIISEYKTIKEFYEHILKNNDSKNIDPMIKTDPMINDSINFHQWIIILYGFGEKYPGTVERLLTNKFLEKLYRSISDQIDLDSDGMISIVEFKKFCQIHSLPYNKIISEYKIINNSINIEQFILILHGLEEKYPDIIERIIKREMPKLI